MVKKFVLICVTFLSLGLSCAEKNNPRVLNRNSGYVPNEASAIKIAEAIWLPIYGEDIYNKKPFKATLKDSLIWVVQGTLDEDFVGGVPYAEIQKSDGKILKVTHSK